jgi:beta-galactosidase
MKDSSASVRYELLIDGTLWVFMSLDIGPEAPELPRIGVQFAIPAGFDRVSWFGRGP